jgi:FkbM family methyltransferase
VILLNRVAIKNARLYFFKRLLAWICIKIPIFLKFWEVFGLTKKGLPLRDVEAVYSHLNVDREAENISLINAVYKGRGGVFYDIGSNYTQFTYGVRNSFSSVRCFDANPEVLDLGRKYYYSENISYYNAAVIPTKHTSESAYFVINRNNTGISEVVFDINLDGTQPKNALPIDCLAMSDILDDGYGDDDLVKIDVEGLEIDLVTDLLRTTSFTGVFCFESLTRLSRQKFSGLFSDFDYVFYVAKYDFSEFSGRMARSFVHLGRVMFTGNAALDVFKSEDIDGFEYDFIPLIFCVPRRLAEQFEQNLTKIDGAF